MLFFSSGFFQWRMVMATDAYTAAQCLDGLVNKMKSNVPVKSRNQKVCLFGDSYIELFQSHCNITLPKWPTGFLLLYKYCKSPAPSLSLSPSVCVKNSSVNSTDRMYRYAAISCLVSDMPKKSFNATFRLSDGATISSLPAWKSAMAAVCTMDDVTDSTTEQGCPVLALRFLSSSQNDHRHGDTLPTTSLAGLQLGADDKDVQ